MPLDKRELHRHTCWEHFRKCSQQHLPPTLLRSLGSHAISAYGDAHSPLFVRTAVSPAVDYSGVIRVVLAGFFAFVFAPITSHASGNAFIRINQLGCATTATKRAYLMASATEAGATFSVKNSSGTTVASARVLARGALAIRMCMPWISMV